MCERGDRVDQVLAVVNDQEKASTGKRTDNALLNRLARLLRDAKHAGHYVAHRAGVADSGEFDEPYAVWEIPLHFTCHVDGESGLADPTDAAERYQAGFR